MPTARLGLRSSAGLRGCPRARTHPPNYISDFLKIEQKLKVVPIVKVLKIPRASVAFLRVHLFNSSVKRRIAVKWCFEIYNITVQSLMRTSYHIMCCPVMTSEAIQ